MIPSVSHAFCSEFYVVEKVIQVVANIGGEDRAIKIEALLNPNTGDYSTASYIKDDFILQPTYPQESPGSGQKLVPVRSPHSVALWVVYDLPWTRGRSADQVLAEALGFLRERTSER